VGSWNCHPIGAAVASVIERQFKVLPGIAPGEVEKWLAPLLRQSRKLTEIQVLKHQLKN
jgi:hypothetical protein